jgi:hypothetical protein
MQSTARPNITHPLRREQEGFSASQAENRKPDMERARYPNLSRIQHHGVAGSVML